MVKQDLLTLGKGNPAFRYLLSSLLVIFLSVFSGFGQSQSQIACNNNVQISLNEQCKATVFPSVILEGEPVNADDIASGFKVRVSGITPTNPYTHPVISTPGNYSVTVTNAAGNSCWGTILAEDKLPPQITSCPCAPGNQDPACAFRCTDEEAFFNNQINYPKPGVNENCGSFTTKFADEIIPSYICGQKIVRRTWQYTDAYGNKSQTCTTEYRFNPVTIENVEQPTNNVALTCGADASPQGVFNFIRSKGGSVSLANTAAWPTVYGVPLKTQVCNLMVAYADTELPACAPSCNNSKKVIRVWTILDWCNGSTRNFPQVIKAADEEAPTITATNITVSVDPWACVANFTLPKPGILHDNCDANPRYTVSGPVGVMIVFDPLTGQYVASGAPKGVQTFTYTAVDCCGNNSEVDIIVTVVDKTPPVAIAKQFIVISLTTGGESDGIAKLFTNSVDNGSYDSCTPVHLEIRRESDPCGFPGNTTYNNDGHSGDSSNDTDGGSFVKFCCKDITNRTGAIPFGIVRVWMRVWDDADGNGKFGSGGDNYNETWVEVRVEDKLVPTIKCPQDITIGCDEDCKNLDLTGRATAYSNCLDVETDYVDREFLDVCNNGYILRTWRVKSLIGIACTQRITKVNRHGLFDNSKIVWPSDITTNCANSPDFGTPKWTAGPCDLIGASLKSDTFYFEGNSCMKILNKWTVVNWCTHNPNASQPVGIWSRTQVIKIIDEVKPTLGSCSDLMFEINDHNDADNDGNLCENKSLTLSQTATDQGQCASDWLKWIVFVDLWADGTNDYEYSSFLPVTDGTFNDTNGNGIPDRYVAPTGQGGVVRVTIPEDIEGNMSNHKVTWRVVDGCGNVTACSQNFMVVDKKKPTPYCLNISSALMQNGKVELWAVDFNLGSFDNCTSKSNLLYTFNAANPVLTRLNQVHFFKGNGQNATEAEYNAGNAQKWLPASKSSGMVFDCGDLPSTEVRMTVWDEKLNFDFCTVILNLADNQGACGGSIMTSVAGKVVSNMGQQVVNAEIILDNGIPEMSKTVLSTGTGSYLFSDAPMHYNYSITGKKNDDYLNGVSTLDLVLIQRHVLGMTKLANPYHVIAADVNSDEKVTAADLVELRKLILGIYPSLPKSGSWKFLADGQTFADANNPWPFNERIYIEDLDHQMTNQNFVGVKIGDVNGTATSNANSLLTEQRSQVNLTTENVKLAAHQSHIVALAANVDNIYGMQFTLTLNDALLTDIYVGGNRLSDAHIAKITENKYNVSWNDMNPIGGDQLITLHVTPSKNTDLSTVLQLNSSLIAAEVYSGDYLQTGKLSLRFADIDDNGTFEVFQNEPNPFQDKTTISFNLPEAGNATLKVFDVTGQVIYNKTTSFSKGVNTFTLSKSDIPSTGVLIYQVESGANTKSKKMIGLE